MNGELPISKDTYISAENETHFREMQYDLLAAVVRNCHECRGSVDSRLTKLERRKNRDTGMAAFFGLVGGFIAALVKGFIK